MPGSFTSWPVDSAEVSVTRDPLWCIITPSTPSLWSTTQTCSTGTWQRFCQETHPYPMLTESGEPDKLLCTISTTEPPTDTDTESQDTLLGTALRTSPLCPTWSTWGRRLSMEHSRGTTIPLLNSSEQNIALRLCSITSSKFLTHRANCFTKRR